MNNIIHTVDSDGSDVWRLNGEIHNNCGPAIIDPSGEKLWCLHGKLHRKNGPAVIFPSGSKEWWLGGKHYSFNDWCNKLNLSKERRIELKLRYE